MTAKYATIQPHTGHNDWLSPDELKQLTPEKLIDRVKGIKGFIAVHAMECERLRHPVDSVMQAIRKTGVFYHFVPKKYGGLEYDLLNFIDVGLAIAEGCASTAWVTCFCIEHNFLAAQLPAQGQNEIFGAFPYTIAVGSAAPPASAVRVAGGFRVTGHLKYASGVVHSDWMQLVASVKSESGASSAHFMMLPIQEVTIVDTWLVDGLAGTGSNDVVLDDVFVPAYRSVDFEELRAGRGHGGELYDNPLYRIPVDILLNVSSSIPAIGTALATVAAFRERVIEKAPIGPEGKTVPKLTSQMRLAEAELAAHTAAMLLREAARNTQESVLAGRRLTNEERVKTRSRIAYAVDLARRSVRIIFEGAGSSAHALSNPIQRAMRDVNMIASHAVYDKDTMLELWGKVLTGTASPEVFKHHSRGQAREGEQRLAAAADRDKSGAPVPDGRGVV